jgi:hypothetical protein
VQWIVVRNELDGRPRYAAIAVGRNARKMHLIRRNQIARGDGRPAARRRFGPILHPRGQMGEQRAHGPVMRIWIRLLLAGKERFLGRQGQLGLRMLGRCHDVAPDVSRFIEVLEPQRIGKAERLA